MSRNREDRGRATGRTRDQNINLKDLLEDDAYSVPYFTLLGYLGGGKFGKHEKGVWARKTTTYDEYSQVAFFACIVQINNIYMTQRIDSNSNSIMDNLQEPRDRSEYGDREEEAEGEGEVEDMEEEREEWGEMEMEQSVEPPERYSTSVGNGGESLFDRESWTLYSKTKRARYISDQLNIDLRSREFEFHMGMIHYIDYITIEIAKQATNPRLEFQVELFEQWGEFFPSKEKLLVYGKSKTFFMLIEFVIRFYCHIGSIAMEMDWGDVDREEESTFGDHPQGGRPPTEKKVKSLMLVQFYARCFSYFMNQVFQFPVELLSGYTVNLMSHGHRFTSPDVWGEIHDKATEHGSYRSSFRNFFLMWRTHNLYTEQERWKKKNTILPTILYEITERVSSPLFQHNLLKNYDLGLANNLLYINIVGWSDELLRRYRKRYNSRDGKLKYIFDVDQSLAFLHDFHFFMKFIAGIDDWTRYNVIMDPTRRWAGFLTTHPKIIRLSKNEWGILYLNRIDIGFFPQVMSEYKDIMSRDFRNHMLIDGTGTVKRYIPGLLESGLMHGNYVDLCKVDEFDRDGTEVQQSVEQSVVPMRSTRRDGTTQSSDWERLSTTRASPSIGSLSDSPNEDSDASDGDDIDMDNDITSARIEARPPREPPNLAESSGLDIANYHPETSEQAEILTRVFEEQIGRNNKKRDDKKRNGRKKRKKKRKKKKKKKGNGTNGRRKNTRRNSRRM